MKYIYKNIKNNQSGSVMVMGIIIMAIISVIAFALSRVIILQIDFSQNLDNAVLSYYGAESGMEQGLYEVRKLDISQLSDVNTMTNDVEWTRTINPVETSVTFPEIVKNRSIQLDLYDPDDPACNSEPITGIACDWESMIISWTGVGTAQIAYSEWDIGAAIDWDPSETTEKKYINANSPWVINDFDSSKNYRVKVKALFNSISDVTVTLYSENNGSGDIVPIPNFLTITGIGDYKTSKQAIQVNVPRKAPLSSLFDYVIFSEEDITKEF